MTEIYDYNLHHSGLNFSLTFCESPVGDWNALPAELKVVSSLLVFKFRLRSFLIAI